MGSPFRSAWYLNSIRNITGDTDFDHLNLYASANLGTVAGFDVSLSYTHHWFPEANDNNTNFGEIGLHLRRSLGFVDFVAESSYFTDVVSDWYHQVGLEKTIGLTDNVSLVLAGGAGYADRFNYDASGWNHYYLKASLPIQLNCRAVLTPFVGYHFDHSDDLFGFQTFGLFEDKLYSGISLSVSF